MFDIVFDVVGAFNYAGILLATFVCLGLGGLILGNGLYWRLHAQKIKGQTIGVRRKGKFYYSVYSFILPTTGETIEATSDSGSTSLLGRHTGKDVSLLFFPHEPEKVRRTNSWVLEIVGAMILIPGVLFGQVIFTAPSINVMTFMVLAALILFLILKLKSKLKAFGRGGLKGVFRQHLKDKYGENWEDALLKEHEGRISQEDIETLRAMQDDGNDVNPLEKSFKKGHADKWKNIPIERYEDLIHSEEGRKITQQQRQSAKVAMPLLFLIGFVLAGLGIYIGQETALLEKEGLRTEGTVTGFKQKYDSDSGYTYHAIVRFQNTDKVNMTFTDSMGSSSRLFRRGDKVTVLYLEDDPEDSVIIDRGLMNWIFPGILGLFGLGCLVGGAHVLKTVRRSEVR